MDGFISRKRKLGEDTSQLTAGTVKKQILESDAVEEDSTDIKLAVLASLCSCEDPNVLLETLVAAGGSVAAAAKVLSSASGDGDCSTPQKRPVSAALGYQSSLSSFRIPKQGDRSPTKKSVSKKGRTLHLYSPEDIAEYTPCSIIHNFLPVTCADALLRELLEEAPTWWKDTFQLFDRTVTSPHTSCFYVDSAQDIERQKSEYAYNGKYISDVRQTRPEMLKVSKLVQTAVNEQIAQRVQTHYPDGKKLKYQSSKEWIPNTAVVNCYDGAKQSVGYHTDQLTYLGPRAVIGSLSLGVAREFRVRRIVPHDLPSGTSAEQKLADLARADTEGQIAIHLPHNSLLVMHAEMQEEWKHSISPAQTIEPHPLAQNKRINITYRCYRKSFGPEFTPRCRCKVPCQLKCVQRQTANRGKYMWMCDVGSVPGKQSCGYFQWAEFDDEGEPPWAACAKLDRGDG